MKLNEITPLLLTFNEAPNLERVLERLQWAQRIVVVDSFSDDTTLESVARFTGSEVFQRNFDNFANQWNYGLDHVETEWVLTLDADYVLSELFPKEITALSPDKNTNGYFAPFRYCVFGKPLRASLLPPRCVLFRREKGSYVCDGHRQLLKLEGSTATLQNPIDHDDRKSMERWLLNQNTYARQEVAKLLSEGEQLGFADRLRRTKILSPLVVFFYVLLVKGCLLDGWRGWYYTLQRCIAEAVLCLHLIEEESMDKERK